MKTLAGYLLYFKNPKIAPPSIIDNIPESPCFNTIAATKKVIEDIKDIPPASPSIPSDQFITVVTPKIQVIVKIN